jgi:hypothetical protein
MSERFEQFKAKQKFRKEFVESGAAALLEEFNEHIEKNFLGQPWDRPLFDLTGLSAETITHLQAIIRVFDFEDRATQEDMMVLLGAWLGKRHATEPKAKAIGTTAAGEPLGPTIISTRDPDDWKPLKP